MPAREYLDQSNVLVGDGRANINFISLQHTATLASGLLIYELSCSGLKNYLYLSFL